MEIKIIVNESEAQTYQEAINFTGNRLVEEGIVKPEYVKACIDRELNFPTGLMLANNQGIAMPHGDADLVYKNGISVLRLKKPVEFGRMEDKSKKVPCTIIFNLALSSGKEHIKTLRKLINLFQDSDFMALCQNESIKTVQDLLLEKLDN